MCSTRVVSGLLPLQINQDCSGAAALTQNISVYIKQRDTARYAGLMSLTSLAELMSCGEIPQTLQLSNKLEVERRRRGKKNKS